MKLHLAQLAIVPVLSASVLTAVACKEEGRSTDSSTVYTYELEGSYSPGSKQKIGARYEYGSRAAKMSSQSGTVRTKVVTAGPKTVRFTVLAPMEANGKTVRCSIIVSKNGERLATINNSGKNQIGCTFKP